MTTDVRGRAVVVGGGPAGLMAAEVLAFAGCDVTVFEHMPSVGRKFVLAGRSGLNLSHAEPLEQLLQRYGTDGTGDVELVRRAVSAFPPSALRAWCAELGEETFVGSSGRLFPRSLRATPLLRAWLARLSGLGVTIVTRHRWVGWAPDGSGRLRFRDAAGVVDVPADVAVLALGGASWPRVGSDGGWVPVLQDVGVRVEALQPSNAGVLVPWTDGFLERFEGEPVKNVAVCVQPGAAVRGDVVITRTGLEGGPVYACGPEVRRALRVGTCVLSIDLHPDLARDELARRLAARPSDSVSTVLARQRLAPVAIGLLRDATGNRVPRDADELAALVKAVPVQVSGLAPVERAISTAGGVALDAVDERFMLAAVPGVFVAGEMLAWDAPTGGYLLQACLSTGTAAADGALAWLRGAGQT